MYRYVFAIKYKKTIAFYGKDKYYFNFPKGGNFLTSLNSNKSTISLLVQN